MGRPPHSSASAENILEAKALLAGYVGKSPLTLEQIAEQLADKGGVSTVQSIKNHTNEDANGAPNRASVEAYGHVLGLTTPQVDQLLDLLGQRRSSKASADDTADEKVTKDVGLPHREIGDGPFSHEPPILAARPPHLRASIPGWNPLGAAAVAIAVALAVVAGFALSRPSVERARNGGLVTSSTTGQASSSATTSLQPASSSAPPSSTAASESTGKPDSDSPPDFESYIRMLDASCLESRPFLSMLVDDFLGIVGGIVTGTEATSKVEAIADWIENDSDIFNYPTRPADRLDAEDIIGEPYALLVEGFRSAADAPDDEALVEALLPLLLAMNEIATDIAERGAPECSPTALRPA